MITAILFDVLAPILILMGAGALLRWRFQIDLATLSKINIYLLAPAFVLFFLTAASGRWRVVCTPRAFALAGLFAAAGAMHPPAPAASCSS